MHKNFLKFNFLIVLAGISGSLYFSEILKYPPCVLCWYQRICLYPLVVIFGIGIWYNDNSYRKYALPLLVSGLVISGYHNLVYYGFVSEALTPCTQGVSCSSRQLELFGYITIPLLSLFAFITCTYLTILSASSNREQR